MRKSDQNPRPLTDFPRSELWRLFIDGYRQNEGPLTFDVKEKGYLAGVLASFDYLISHISEPVTTNMILTLHNTALKPVNEASEKIVYHKKEFNFRGREGINFGIVLNTTIDPNLTDLQQDILRKKANFSEEGLRELQELMNSGQGQYIKIENEDTRQLLDSNMPFDELATIVRENSCSVFLEKDSIENMHARIQSSIDTYYSSLLNATNDDEKLIAIIRFVKDLEVNHYFTDANCRTTVCLLMNKLLIDNGFCPCIHENPNRMDGYSMRELLSEVKNGMERFWNFTIQPDSRTDLKQIPINNSTDMAALKDKIEGLISTDPICALAQINHIASNVTEYFSVKSSSVPFISQLLEKQNFRQELRECLNILYTEQVNKCLVNNHDLTPRSFSDIIANHQIFNNNPKLVQAISQAFNDRHIAVAPKNN